MAYIVVIILAKLVVFSAFSAKKERYYSFKVEEPHARISYTYL